MAGIRDRLHNSIIERLILRYAGPFLSNIEIKSHISEGKIFINNIKQKEDSCFFEQVEQLLVKLGVDVWGVNGLPMIWPHGVEITAATIRNVEIKVPTPNPFNGEMWKIYIDGVDGEVRTLTSERKAQLARTARKKALQEAEKRWKMQTNVPNSPVQPVVSQAMVKSRDSVDHDELDDEGNISEGGLAKRIDRYFKNHLDISFNNCHVILRSVEDKEVPEACWDLTLGRMAMDLSVDEIELPQWHHNAVAAVTPSSRYGRSTPPDVKLFEEKIGLVFSALHLEAKRSLKDPPAAVLNFPDTMMKLHVVRKQWPENDTSQPNGFDRIHVELPDSFDVQVHLDQAVLRASLIRVLHQIFDGVAVNVPNWVDWIAVPWPNGWTREGKLTPPKDDPTGLKEEYLSLLGKERIDKSGTSACRDVWPPFFCITSNRGNVLNGLSTLGSGREKVVGSERLEWFETTQTTEWLAYCQNHMEAHGMDDVPETGRPLYSWLVVPWRRYEITMAFGASFSVEISSGEGKDRGHRMGLKFPPNMATVLVRDSPAEWTVNAKIPGLQISTEALKWLDIRDIGLKLSWGRQELQPAHKREKLPAEELVPSVCRVEALTVGSMAMLFTPAIAVVLMPMLTELPEVALWPELHYFFGEWGYMPRPLAYVVDSASIKNITIVLSTGKSAVKKYPDAEFAITVNTVDISSGGEPIYMDNKWQAWWNLRVYCGEIHISTHLERLQESLFTASAVGIKTARKAKLIPTYASLEENVTEHETKPVCGNEVHLMHAEFVISPDILLCFGKLGTQYYDKCKPYLKDLGKSVVKVFNTVCGIVPPTVPELPSWIWPCTLSVHCDEVDPFIICAKHTLCKVFQLKVSFKLNLVLQEQVMQYDSPFFVLHMTESCACIECFDEDGSEAWEPLMEPWNFEMGVQLHLPPKPRLKVLLMQDHRSTKSIDLDVTSVLVTAARSLFFAYVPLIKTAIEDGVTSEAFRTFLDKRPSSARMSALNLSGSPITAWLVFLPRTATDVVIKMQALFRAKRARRRVKEMRPKNPDAPQDKSRSSNAYQFKGAESVKPTADSGEDGVTATPTIAQSIATTRNSQLTSGLFFAAGKVHPLAMCENQRLSINLKALPRDLPPLQGPNLLPLAGPRGLGARVQAVATGRIPLTKSVTGSLTKIRRQRGLLAQSMKSLCNRLRGKRKNNLHRNVSQSVGFGVGSDVARLMNICRHGQTAVIPASVGKKAAYVCEVISPSVNDRMLLVQSPFRVFNYTSMCIDVLFTNGNFQYEVDDNIARGCSCSADMLGMEQPCDPQPYGLPAADLSAATSKDGAWRLPSNVFASVPPHLRHPKGGLMFRLRSPNCTSWDSETYDCDKMERGDEFLYRLPCGDTVRIAFLTHQRFESALVACTGQRVTCCDICIKPCLSILSMCPLPLDVQLDAKGQQKDAVRLEPGKTKNFYRHVHVSIKLRWSGKDKNPDDKSGKWSSHLSHIDSREKHLNDELVTLPAHEGIGPNGKPYTLASTEVNVRHLQEVCIISSPLWLVDKTGLGLKGTDKKGHDFPTYESYFLPASKGDALLSLDDNDGNAKRKTSSIHLPSHFFRKDSTEVVMQEPPSRSYPLLITSQSLDNLFGEFQVQQIPPVQLLTVMPGLLFSSTLPVSLRFNGGEPMPIEANKATPVWPEVSGKMPHALDDHQVELRVDLSSEWSKPIKCSHSLTGVYSLAMAPIVMGSASSMSLDSRASGAPVETKRADHHGAVRTLSVEISDAADSVLSFHVSDQSDEIKNMSHQLELCAVETDSHEVARSSRRGRRSSKQRRSSRTSTTSTEEHIDVPDWAFCCYSGESVNIGWFQPFAKDKQLDDVKVYLRWEGEDRICGPVSMNLHSTIIYVFLRPSNPDGSGKTTVARVRQHKQRRCIEIFDEEFIGSQSGYHAEEICGVCGASLREINRESEAGMTAVDSMMAPLLIAAGSAQDTATALFGTLAAPVVQASTVLGTQLGIQNTKSIRSDGAVEDSISAADIWKARDRNEDQEMLSRMKSGISLASGKTMTTSSKIKCSKCSSELEMPGFDLFGVGTSTASVFHQERKGMTKERKMNAAKTPFATLASVKKWFGALVADCSVRIPACGISLISKRSGSEVLYCLVEGIQLSFQAPEGFNTHMMRLYVQGVRCDRFDVQAGVKSPSVLASTVAHAKGQAPQHDMPALDVTVVRTFVSAFDIFIKEATVKILHTFECDIDTDFMNDLFDIGDEFAEALGPVAHHLHASIGVVEELSPCLVFDRLREMGEEKPEWQLQRAGRVIQLENYDASNIDVKIWLKIKLNEMKFIPSDARRMLGILGSWIIPSLHGTKLHIEAKRESMIRGSAVKLGKDFFNLYWRDILKVAKSLLGTTKLTRGHSDTQTPGLTAKDSQNYFGVGQSTVSREMLEEEAKKAAAETDEKYASTVAKMNKQHTVDAFKEWNTKRRTGYPVPHDQAHPACTGEPFLRRPRLVLARGRVTHYDEFHAEVLQSMGREHLKECLSIVNLSQGSTPGNSPKSPMTSANKKVDPEARINVIILTMEHLTWASLSPEALLANRISGWSGLQHTQRESQILCQWPWSEVQRVTLTPSGEVEVATVSKTDSSSVEVHKMPCNMTRQDRAMLSSISKRLLRQHHAA